MGGPQKAKGFRQTFGGMYWTVCKVLLKSMNSVWEVPKKLQGLGMKIAILCVRSPQSYPKVAILCVRSSKS